MLYAHQTRLNFSRPNLHPTRDIKTRKMQTSASPKEKSLKWPVPFSASGHNKGGKMQFGPFMAQFESTLSKMGWGTRPATLLR